MVDMDDDVRTYGDMLDAFNRLETAEDHKQFYLEYWRIVENKINEENKIKLGDERRFDLVYDRLRSNLCHMLGDVSEMRRNYAYKVWWFLV